MKKQTDINKEKKFKKVEIHKKGSERKMLTDWGYKRRCGLIC